MYHLKATAREEFDASVFGPIDDVQWQWLKEFVDKHHICDRFHGVIGFKIGDQIYHPDEVEIIVRD